jgi:broad specificity phosphatase PhoE
MRNDLSDQDRKRRRRRRRIQVIIIYTAIAIGLAWFFESQATTTIIFVRHADKAVTQANDPGLSPAGERRAMELARQLVDADVIRGVDAIYSTPFKRTKQTAQAVADALDLPVYTYDVADTEPVLESILKKHKGKIILVVAHSNTLPVLIANLGASKRVPPIAEDEYDNIYIISIPWFGKTKTIRLRYGQPYVPDEAQKPKAD